MRAVDMDGPEGPSRGERGKESAWSFSDRLTRFAKKFVGPAQVSPQSPRGDVDTSLPGTPCTQCGLPLNGHELVRTTDAKMRLYCPSAEPPA